MIVTITDVAMVEMEEEHIHTAWRGAYQPLVLLAVDVSFSNVARVRIAYAVQSVVRWYGLIILLIQNQQHAMIAEQQLALAV